MARKTRGVKSQQVPGTYKPPEQWDINDVKEILLAVEQTLAGIVMVLDLNINDDFGQIPLQLERIETFLYPLLPKEQKEKFENFIHEKIAERQEALRQAIEENPEGRSAIGALDELARQSIINKEP